MRHLNNVTEVRNTEPAIMSGWPDLCIVSVTLEELEAKFRDDDDVEARSQPWRWF